MVLQPPQNCCWERVSRKKQKRWQTGTFGTNALEKKEMRNQVIHWILRCKKQKEKQVVSSSGSDRVLGPFPNQLPRVARFKERRSSWAAWSSHRREMQISGEHEKGVVCTFRIAWIGMNTGTQDSTTGTQPSQAAAFEVEELLPAELPTPDVLNSNQMRAKFNKW